MLNVSYDSNVATKFYPRLLTWFNFAEDSEVEKLSESVIGTQILADIDYASKMILRDRNMLKEYNRYVNNYYDCADVFTDDVIEYYRA